MDGLGTAVRGRRGSQEGGKGLAGWPARSCSVAAAGAGACGTVHSIEVEAQAGVQACR
jgi:hypothetical protein